MGDLFGQAQVDALAETLSALYDQKIEPSGEALQSAYDALVLAEQEYENFLDPQAASMLQPAALLTVGAVCAAGGILLTGLGTIAYCVQEVLKEQQACIQGYIEKGYSKDVAGLACTLQNPEAIKKCGIDVAMSAYTTALSAGAAGYKKLQFIIDALSAYDSGGKIKAILGERGCSSSQGFAYQTGKEGALSAAAAPNPDATYFLGTGDEGMFLVPEGDWTFMAVADGYARSMTGCVSVTGTGEIIEETVTMVPSDETEDVVDDLDGDGYNVCQGDCDNNTASVYPGAAETCGDGIDNDCDEAIDCLDSDCAQDEACKALETWYVWYADNIGLKPVMVGTNTSFAADTLCSSYPGGGTSPTTLMDKIAIVEAYPTRDEAIAAACSQFDNIRAVPPTSTFIWTDWLADLGGERHDIDELGGCQ